ncbi:S1-like domain-containing RNA-binding protein [Parendozoicomonas sp. Alg238-R29]|uniref:CvfB family protein n=1 Tax=Parendozoicomonas sp. Alg238-R29 TaxID=2993446 RepID=UPI00248DED1D|nr:S1-like domain-containing RNA-binding protein [Parendozoicomonas sp. Alg238-R29]
MTNDTISEVSGSDNADASNLHVKIGHWNTLKIIREKGFGVYLEGGQYVDILLPKRYVPKGSQIGDLLDVFIYLDSNDDVIATTDKPKAKLGEFACLKAEEVNQVGAFLDWGLPKQLLVPFSEQKVRMRQGQYYVVYLYQEDRNWRIVASSKIDKYLDSRPPSYDSGEEVSLMITDRTDIGYMAIINNHYQGVIFHNDIHQPVRMGQKLKGYIKRVRPDQKIDLCLQNPKSYKSAGDFSDQIIEKLKEHDGFLPIHDKSTPEEISKYFKTSKRVFKMAIGGLYKSRQIVIEKDGIRLAD